MLFQTRITTKGPRITINNMLFYKAVHDKLHGQFMAIICYISFWSSIWLEANTMRNRGHRPRIKEEVVLPYTCLEGSTYRETRYCPPGREICIGSNPRAMPPVLRIAQAASRSSQCIGFQPNQNYRNLYNI